MDLNISTISQNIKWYGLVSLAVNIAVAIGTILLAFMAYKQMKELRYERKRKIALDLASTTICLLAYVTDLERAYDKIPKHYLVTPETCIGIPYEKQLDYPPMEDHRLRSGISTLIQILYDTAILLNDQEITRIINEINTNRLEKEIPKLQQLIQTIMKKYDIPIRDIKRNARAILQ